VAKSSTLYWKQQKDISHALSSYYAEGKVVYCTDVIAKLCNGLYHAIYCIDKHVGCLNQRQLGFSNVTVIRPGTHIEQDTQYNE